MKQYLCKQVRGISAALYIDIVNKKLYFKSFSMKKMWPAQFAVIDEPIDSNFLLVFFYLFAVFVFFQYFFSKHLAVTNLHLAAALVENRALHFSGIEFHRRSRSWSRSQRNTKFMGSPFCAINSLAMPLAGDCRLFGSSIYSPMSCTKCSVYKGYARLWQQVGNLFQFAH